MYTLTNLLSNPFIKFTDINVWKFFRNFNFWKKSWIYYAIYYAMQVDKILHLDNPLFDKNNHDKVFFKKTVCFKYKTNILILENCLYSRKYTDFNIRLFYLHLQFF